MEGLSPKVRKSESPEDAFYLFRTSPFPETLSFRLSDFPTSDSFQNQSFNKSFIIVTINIRGNLVDLVMKKLPIFLIALLFCFRAFSQNQVDTVQQIIPGRVNSPAQQNKPYVIMISADGFRYDYAQKYKAEHLLALSDAGVSAASMIPAFPSVTFPNHYTLVTGLYPAHHGLVSNDFYAPARHEAYSMNNKNKVKDGTWYGGTPLWVLAEQQKMLTASFYWVASEADIQGVKPTYYYNYNTKISIHNRIQGVVNWLNLPPEKRPHFITFYFPEVDHAGHTYGPDAPETEKQVQYIDSAVYQLTQAVKTTGLKVSFIFVSDHGMSRIDNVNPIPLPAVDTSQFVISGESTMPEFYAKKPEYITPEYEKLKAAATNYTVYLKSEMPAYLHYGTADDWANHIGDILLIPTWPKVFKMSERYSKINPGTHGFDPYKVKEMHATFYAWGPAFKSNLKIPAFENVNVYPIVTGILGLSITGKIDGTNAVADKILTGK